MSTLDPSAVAASWRPLLAVLPAGDALDALVVELASRYAEPHRRYHGIAHIDALARLFAEVGEGPGAPGWRQPAEVALAILIHDAIYEVSRADNEARSAGLARARLDGWIGIDVERVAVLIEATAAHGRAQTHGDPDLGHFLDADLAILGAPADVYDRYARGVFEEYSPIVDAAQFTAGRQAFVRSQLARPTLFHTEFFRARYEAQARRNLARELA
jgi:predicted metal-dependent HD superfamily phosphohydrolase